MKTGDEVEEPEASRQKFYVQRMTDRWSRTVIVGIMGIFGLTMLGIAAILFDKSDGATLGAIVAGVTSCVGAVAGRQSSNTRS